MTSEKCKKSWWTLRIFYNLNLSYFMVQKLGKKIFKCTHISNLNCISFCLIKFSSLKDYVGIIFFCISKLIFHFWLETRSNTLVPLVRKICERALRVEDATLPITAHHLGRICHGLHGELIVFIFLKMKIGFI